MNARDLKTQLSQALLENSGLEQKRPYLGMSQIGRCPRQLYRMMMEGRSAVEMSDQRHWYCWTGCLHEAAIADLVVRAHYSLYLLGGGLDRRQVEIVAEFDERYRGHVDYEWIDNDGAIYLLEIKSVSWRKFGHIIQARRPGWLHYCQVQAYMRHGQYPRAFIVYLARDVPHREWRGVPLWVFDVQYNEELAMDLDRKARSILACVDNGNVMPRCECGKCD